MEQHLDHDYVERLIKSLGRIKPEARPAWGKLTPAGMVQHLADTIRYSMGRAGDLPNASTWLSRRIAAPLILHGILRIPKNIKGFDYSVPMPAADIESLHAVLDEYLALVQAGELDPKPHPFFGDIGVDGWARLHVIHFEHHLRQFGESALRK
jgi:hypothetical protein